MRYRLLAAAVLALYFCAPASARQPRPMPTLPAADLSMRGFADAGLERLAGAVVAGDIGIGQGWEDQRVRKLVLH